ncbi:uncharacterized protein LOC136042149 [Artemia franciscana]|uniref:uncharacterized protein LOC136042149 n=1 Tax=Artemia franciscana TaxID=6661 RepID=UPI0032D9F425
MSFRLKRNNSSRSSSHQSTLPRIASVFLEEINSNSNNFSLPFDNEVFDLPEDLQSSPSNSSAKFHRPKAPTPTSSSPMFEIRESPIGSFKQEYHIEISSDGERGSPGQRSQDSGFLDSKLSPGQSPNDPADVCKGSEFCSCLDISVKDCLTPKRNEKPMIRPTQIFTPSRLRGELKIEENVYERIRNSSPEESSVPLTKDYLRKDINDILTKDVSVEANFGRNKRNSGTQTDFCQHRPNYLTVEQSNQNTDATVITNESNDAIFAGLISEKKVNNVNYSGAAVEKFTEKYLFERHKNVSKCDAKESFFNKFSPGIRKVGGNLLKSFKGRVKPSKSEENFRITSLITPDIAPFFETVNVTPEINSGSSSPILQNYRSGPRSSTPRKKPPCLRKKSLERSIGRLDHKKSRVRWSDMPDFNPPRFEENCTCNDRLNRSKSLDALPSNGLYYGLSMPKLRDDDELIPREDIVEQPTMDSLENLSENGKCLRENEEVARSFAKKMLEAKLKDDDLLTQFRLNPLDHWLEHLTLELEQECTVALQSKDIPVPTVVETKANKRKSRPVDYLYL